MKCPGCRSAETRTAETRTHGMIVMRRQRCEACRGVWSTQELVVPDSFEKDDADTTRSTSVVQPQPTGSTPVALGGKGGDPGSSLSLFSGSLPDASLESSSDRQSDEAWPADFAAFLAAYPAHRRKKKSDALRAWNRRRPPLAKVLEALAWQVRTHEWTKERGQFVPLPASYINAGGWMDERAEPPPAIHPRDRAFIDSVKGGS
jgi:hypothetical protein